MRFLLDTHLLIWLALGSDRLSAATIRRIEDPAAEPMFSAASIWEVAIKAALGRPDFTLDAGDLRNGLLRAGYTEIPITGAHAAQVSQLPPLHRDPFDRMLIAQAIVERVTLLTVDKTLERYPAPVERVAVNAL